MRMRIFATLALALGLVACSATIPGAQQTPTTGAPVVVGIPLSFTGSLSSESAQAKAGYQLWLDWVNGHEGGLDVAGVKHRVKIVYGDDQSKPELAAQLAEQMITQDGARFLLGPYGASNTAAVAAVAEQHQIPMVSANGSARSIFAKGYRYVFGVQTPADKNLQSIIDMAAALRPAPSTVAVVSSDDPFSFEVGRGARDYAASKGMHIVFDRQYPSGSTNLYQLLTAAKAANPDILLNSGHLVEAIAINKQSKDIRLNANMFVYSVGPSMPEFAATLGKDANYVYTGSQWTAQARYTPSYYLTAPQYVAAYRKMFSTNQDPNYQVADATAAGIALEQAVQHAGSLGGDQVRKSLSSLDVSTFYGRIKFDSTGQNPYKPMLIEQIQDGRRQTVYPADLAGTAPLFPTPSWTVRTGVPPEAPDAKLPQTGEPAPGV
jgi:branched-chain amino acid transport system substrate-binding protein